MRLARSIVILMIVGLAGCSQDQRERRSVDFSDRAADIRCTSYGEVTFQGRSRGRVVVRRSERIEFVDAATGRLNLIEGDCRIVYVGSTDNPQRR